MVSLTPPAWRNWYERRASRHSEDMRRGGVMRLAMDRGGERGVTREQQRLLDYLLTTLTNHGLYKCCTGVQVVGQISQK